MSVSPEVRINMNIPQLDAALAEELASFDLPTFGHILDSDFVEGLQRVAGGDRPVVGRVVTVQLAGTDSRMVHYSTALVQPGDFVVIETPGATSHACVGGGVAQAYAAAGVVGVAVNGPTTDILELRESGLSFYSRGLSPFTTRNNDGPIAGAINVPVSVGGVRVVPGMIAFGDENGLLITHAEVLRPLLARVREMTNWEPPAMARVRNGEKLADMILPREDLEALNALAQRMDS
jgi:4-hydroxy-4-methyl-2-oxoglutarate aldolase